VFSCGSKVLAFGPHCSRGMALEPAEIVAKTLIFELLECRTKECHSEDEDDVLTILLMDRKRRRRWFDTSHIYAPIAVRGNLAEAIWTSTDERFAEQVRLSRQQFMYVEAALSDALTGPYRSRGRVRVLSPREQVLLFLYHTAQCKYEFINECGARPFRCTLQVSHL
jgi:uncharacterized protein (DUF924 family)